MSGIIHIFCRRVFSMYRKREKTEKRTIENETATKTGLRRGERRQKCLAISAGLPFDRPKARRVIPERPSYPDAKFAKVRNLSESPVSVFFRRRFYSNGMPDGKGICRRINKIKKS